MDLKTSWKRRADAKNLHSPMNMGVVNHSLVWSFVFSHKAHLRSNSTKSWLILIKISFKKKQSLIWWYSSWITNFRLDKVEIIRNEYANDTEEMLIGCSDFHNRLYGRRRGLFLSFAFASVERVMLPVQHQFGLMKFGVLKNYPPNFDPAMMAAAIASNHG